MFGFKQSLSRPTTSLLYSFVLDHLFLQTSCFSFFYASKRSSLSLNKKFPGQEEQQAKEQKHLLTSGLLVPHATADPHSLTHSFLRPLLASISPLLPLLSSPTQRASPSASWPSSSSSPTPSAADRDCDPTPTRASIWSFFFTRHSLGKDSVRSEYLTCC